MLVKKLESYIFEFGLAKLLEDKSFLKAIIVTDVFDYLALGTFILICTKVQKIYFSLSYIILKTYYFKVPRKDMIHIAII